MLEEKKSFLLTLKKPNFKDLQFAHQWTNLNTLHDRKDTSLNIEKAKPSIPRGADKFRHKAGLQMR